MNKRSLNLIGAGRVGQTLAHLWHTHQVFAIQQVHTRHLESAQTSSHFIGAGEPQSDLNKMVAADVWMLAVPDANIAQAAADLAAHAKACQFPPAIALHCSGALTSEVLAPLKDLGWQVASAHCILSFATPTLAVPQFPGTACALEGEANACAVLHEAFTRIDAQCFGVASQDKVLYHAAAVLATNFLPVLESLAEAAWQATGVPASLIPALRVSLMSNTVANIQRLGPAAALTGPAARGDVAAIARQAEVVRAWDPQAGTAYEALSALALRMANATRDATATAATNS